MSKQITIKNPDANSSYPQKISILRLAKQAGVDLGQFGLDKPFSQWDLNMGKASQIIQLLKSKVTVNKQNKQPAVAVANTATKARRMKTIPMSLIQEVFTKAGYQIA